MEVAVNEVVLGKATPEESLKKWQSNATELLKQNKEKYGG